jgi:hypothetical protein
LSVSFRVMDGLNNEHLKADREMENMFKLIFIVRQNNSVCFMPCRFDTIFAKSFREHLKRGRACLSKSNRISLIDKMSRSTMFVEYRKRGAIMGETFFFLCKVRVFVCSKNVFMGVSH